jgi:hypothetical protein
VLAGYMRGAQIRYLSPNRRIGWSQSGYVRKSGSVDANLVFLKRFTKVMADAGVLLVTGTDAPGVPGLIPGYSLHDDMETLQAVDLSRYQVLTAATRAPGELIRRSIPGAMPFGTVTVGSRADLVLAAKNPLDDLSTLRELLGVMVKGRWHPRSDLNSLLEQVANEYKAF